MGVMLQYSSLSPSAGLNINVGVVAHVTSCRPGLADCNLGMNHLAVFVI